MQELPVLRVQLQPPAPTGKSVGGPPAPAGDQDPNVWHHGLMPSLEFHMDGLQQHVSFCVWILSFDIVTELVCVVPCIRRPFLFVAV